MQRRKRAAQERTSMRIGLDLRAALVACGLAAALCAAPAHAVVVDYVFEGLITNGGDLTGVFGDEPSLTGHGITVRTSFDTSVNRLTLPFYLDTVDRIGAVSPLVSATVTIDSHTFTLPSPGAPVASRSAIYTFADGYDFNALEQRISLASGGVEDALAVYLDLRLESLLLPASLDTPFDLTAGQAAGRFDGYFTVGRYDGLYGADVGAGAIFAITRAYATVEQPQAGVPEPAAWALMILGFGAAGAALRRRRGQPAGAWISSTT
jgi:hypothetical protein